MPSSVPMPVAITSAAPVPALTEVPMKTQSVRSARWASAATGAIRFWTGALSPVSGASLIRRAWASTEPGVGGHDVSGLQDQRVADHHLRRGNHDGRPVAQHAGPRRGHGPQGLHRPLRPILLEEADERVEHDDGADGDGVRHLSQQRPTRHTRRGGARSSRP